MTSSVPSATSLADLLPHVGDRTALLGDFGGLVTGETLGIVTPDRQDTLVDLVSLARQRGLAITPRGLGRSQSGQAVPNRSIVVDFRALNRLEPVDETRRTITCEVGSTFRDVLARTLPLGLAPPVCPLNLDLTLGGVLSAGGLGSTSHRFGFAASHVASAKVVLGNGDVVHTGPERERDVFDSVFGGVGRVGLIASVELALTTIAPALRTFSLWYRDLEAMMADQLSLAGNMNVAHLEGMASASVFGMRTGTAQQREPLRRWAYGLLVSVEHGDDVLDESVLQGLHFDEVLHSQHDHPAEFAARYDGRVKMMRATGAWDQAHPWFEALIPMKKARALILEAQKLPPLLGDALRIALVADGDRPRAIAFPEGGAAVTLAILCSGVPETLASAALPALQRLNDAVMDAGGKRYLSGWLFDTGAEGWRRHYGNDYSSLSALAKRFNPGQTLRSKLPFA